MEPPLSLSPKPRRQPPVLLHGDSIFDGPMSPIPSKKYCGFDEDLWHKLLKAADGAENLKREDVQRIVSILRDDSEEDTESHIVSLIMSRLRASKDIMDEGFLRYLSENFNKLVAVPEGNDELIQESARRSSGHSDHLNVDEIPDSTTDLTRISSRVAEYLENIYKWDFNPFKLQELTANPVSTVTMHCLQEYGLVESLDFNVPKLTNFLQAIHDGYNALPYHNALHAADVTQSTFYLLTTGQVVEALQLNQISVASVLIAAAIHDVGHPGLNGKFLITTSSPIAVEYNDKSPLEMMHLATAFRLWRDDSNNFTDRVPVPLYREMRRLIVELVLLTDNDMHFTLLNRLDRFITVHSTPDISDEIFSPPRPSVDPLVRQESLSQRSPATHPSTDERQLLLLQVTLHTADVSNTAKPWDIYGQWLERITEEFYLQGDMERSLNMPISYAFDRFNPVTQSKFQLGFIKAIVGPLYKTLSKVEGVNISDCLEHLRVNARHWKEMSADEDAAALEQSSSTSAGDLSGSNIRSHGKKARRLSPIEFDQRIHANASPLHLDDSTGAGGEMDSSP